MITVFSGTNRPNSLTLKYAQHVFGLLSDKCPGELQFFNLEDFPTSALHTEMYNAEQQHKELSKIQDQYVIGADAFFIVSPEYNGSFPGILKTFIDACSVRAYAQSFSGKKAAFLGVASGRAGNLRGIDHLTGIFHHMNCGVMPKALPLGQSNQALNDAGEIIDTETLTSLEEYANRFLAYYREPVTG